MRRIVCTTLVLLAACHVPPPGSNVDPVDDDYPLAIGYRWTYRAGPLMVTRTIDAEREIDGRRYFEMTFILPLVGTHIISMRRTEDGVVTAREGREHLLMRFPMRAGDRWRIDLPGEKDIADCEVAGEEDVEFLGARGRAMKLRVTRTPRKGGDPTVDYEWYARGVGLVRMDVKYGVRATFVLERFDR